MQTLKNVWSPPLFGMSKKMLKVAGSRVSCWDSVRGRKYRETHIMITQATYCLGAPQPLRAPCLQSCIPSVCALRGVPLFRAGNSIQGLERAVVQPASLPMVRLTLKNGTCLALRFGFARNLRFPLFPPVHGVPPTKN